MFDQPGYRAGETIRNISTLCDLECPAVNQRQANEATLNGNKMRGQINGLKKLFEKGNLCMGDVNNSKGRTRRNERLVSYR